MDFQKNMLASLDSGFKFGQNVKAVQDKRNINMLAGQAYGATEPAQQQSLLSQMAAIDPASAQQQQKAFASDEERRNTTMVNMAKMLTSAPEQARPGLYQQMVPTLKTFGLSDMPQQYDAQTAPIIDKAAQSLVAAYGGASSQAPTDVRSFQMMTQGLSPEQVEEARQIQLGLKGRASNAGYGFFEFEGADGRKRMGRNNPRTGAREVYDEQSGSFVPLDGSLGSQSYQTGSPGFGIAETDNYVRSILGKVRVDPNATPEQQAAQLLPALIQQESGGNPVAVSSKGAVGLTQVMPATGADPGFGVSPLQNNSPEENVRFGRDYLTAMLRRYPGRPDLALAAYNAGPAVADRFAGSVAQNAQGQSFAVGRRAEDQAAAVEAAKLGVQQQFLGRELQMRADAELAQEAGRLRVKQEGERSAAGATRLRDAEETLAVLEEALPLLNTATGSGAGALRDAGAAFVGRATEGAKSNASLRVLATRLTAKVPRFEGPQSDKDVAEYKAAAGDLANEKLPVEIRLAAGETLRRLSQKAVEQAQAGGQLGGGRQGGAPARGRPQPGVVEDGYRFRGGDPADPANWERT